MELNASIFKRHLLLGILFLLGACGDAELSLKTIEVNNEFTIEIPEYLVEMDLENPVASMQYGNDLESHYLVVIRESHEQLAAVGMEMDMDEYASIMVNYAESAITDAQIEPLTEGTEKINGMEAIGYKIHGENHEGLPIFYHIMYLRSDLAFYSVTTWCATTNKENCEPYMERIVHSVKEIESK
jgi:hypothetical protein